jgi:hypothetical protein
MNNEIITFKTAKLANEKEFNISQDCGYESNGTYFDNSQDYDGCKFGYCKEIYLAPTQSMLQRWLREKHQIDIIILPKLKDLGKFYGGYIDNDVKMIHKSYGSNFKTYEEALEEGLYEALKLIKN